MKKIFFVLAASCLLFSGCINITEELFLEKDGSGNYSTTIKLDKLDEMMEMMKSFAPDSVNTESAILVLKDSVQHMMGDISSIPGITNLKNERPDSSTYKISFRFKDVQALNAALKKRNNGKTNTGDIFAFSKGSLSCNDKSIGGMSSLMDELSKQQSPGVDGAPEIDLAQIKALMTMLDWRLTMKTIYHFPAKVTNYTNKMAVLSEDRKTLTLELDLLDDQKDKTLENKVEFR